MPLSDHDRRQLAAIEADLIRSDPAMARAFGPFGNHTEPAPSRSATATSAAFVVVATLLLVSGLIWRNFDMLFGGCLVIIAMPLAVWLVARTGRRRS